jgi:hypothetical protein
MFKRWMAASLVLAFTLTLSQASLAAEATAKAASKPMAKTAAKVFKDNAKSGTGEDSNIKSKREANGTGAGPVAPPKKGGPKTRDVTGWLDVDNWTAWYVDIYTNGSFRGTVPPWGDLYVWTNAGDQLYARADFSDGTWKYWGPQAAWNGQAFWRLWP